MSTGQKITVLEQATPKGEHKYSTDELKSIIRKGHRRFANWEDVVSHIQRLEFDSKPCLPGKGEVLWEALDDVEMASMLVRSGADLCTRRSGDESESGFLHVLSASNDPKKHQLALLMIEEGADVDAKDAEGNTPLQVAVKNEAFGAIVVLIKNTPIPCFLWDKSPESSIALAMRSSNVVKLLTLFYEHCDLNIEDCCDILPWDMPKNHIAAVVKTLLQLARETTKKDVECILRCVLTKDFEWAKTYLFSYKTNRNERSIDPQILLSHYFILEDPTLVLFLLREGANINECVNNEKQYPLHIACSNYKRDSNIVELLLLLGADLNVFDRFGRTPFSMCINNRIHDKMVKVMIEHFACLTSADINEYDLLLIREEPVFQNYYDKCVEELDIMKIIADGILYYNLYRKTSYELSLLMRNKETFRQLRRNLLELKPDTFPIFEGDMMNKFEKARHMRNAEVARERELEDVFVEILPSLVARKIARYSLDLVEIEEKIIIYRVAN